MTPCRLIVHLHIFVSIRTLSSFLHLAILAFSCNIFFFHASLVLIARFHTCSSEGSKK